MKVLSFDQFINEGIVSDDLKPHRLIEELYEVFIKNDYNAFWKTPKGFQGPGVLSVPIHIYPDDSNNSYSYNVHITLAEVQSMEDFENNVNDLRDLGFPELIKVDLEIMLTVDESWNPIGPPKIVYGIELNREGVNRLVYQAEELAFPDAEQRASDWLANRIDRQKDRNRYGDM